MPPAVRLLLACSLVGAGVALLGGCGETPAGAGAGVVAEARLLARSAPADPESKPPRKRPGICSLVTRAEAQAILGTRLLRPLVAPLGPTCIYSASAHPNLVTLAVETTTFKPMLRLLRHARRVRVAGRVAYCGTLGTPTLLLSLPRGRVLTIAASCPKARRFAAAALPRLKHYY